MKVPEGWHKKMVLDFALKMHSGGTPKSDNPNYYNGEIPFVAIEDLTSANKYLNKTQKKITKTGLNNSSAWLVPVNTLMYSIYATLGVPRINLIEVATNQAILNIIPNTEKIELEFLYYLFLEKRNTILAHSAHTTQSNLNAKIVKELEFVFPKSLTEQRQIASILSKVDEAIAQTEALIAKYSRIKTGLMQDLLTKGIDEHGNIRSEDIYQFKDSPLGKIPVEWEVDRLEALCEKIQDGTHFSPKIDENEEFKYITSKNIRMGYLDLSNVEYIHSTEHQKIYKRCSIRYGDVLLTKDGANTGNICLNHFEEEFSLLSSVAFIRGKKDELSNEFILQYFMDERGQRLLTDQMSGNAITRITLTKINNTLITVPPINEQMAIVEKLQQKDKAVETERIILTKLHSLKTGLMQDLLSGKVRVNHLIQEMAESV